LCPSRLCKRCYDALPIDDVTSIDPPNHVIDDENVCEDNDETDDDGSTDDSFFGTRGDQGDDYDDDQSNGSHNAGDIIHDNIDQLGDEEMSRCDPDLLLFNDSDATHEITQDNVVQDHGFFTTNAGDSFRGVFHHDRMERVSGHVILNQAAVCTKRYGMTPYFIIPYFLTPSHFVFAYRAYVLCTSQIILN
jgi:hypothetical protein